LLSLSLHFPIIPLPFLFELYPLIISFIVPHPFSFRPIISSSVYHFLKFSVLFYIYL
jgi:hypothetical protein